jgi:hypothetical protein
MIERHPSGLTWERWHWPFKTDAERLQIQRWQEHLASKTGHTASHRFVFDTSIPF